jgi:catechol 2,3-dioxygenase
MTVRELGHLVLYVHDVVRSAAFYRDVLGWQQILPEPGVEPSASPPSRRVAPTMSSSSLRWGRTPRPSPRGRRVGMYHFGLNVGDSDDDLRAMVTVLKEAGATIVGASDHTVTHSLYIEDPDGNEIELYVDVPGVDWKANPSLVAAPIRPLRL